jgi:hypothetical protein
LTEGAEKERRGISDQEKRTKPWMAMAKSKGAFRSKRPCMTKGTSRLLGFNNLMIQNVQTQKKGAKHEQM